MTDPRAQLATAVRKHSQASSSLSDAIREARTAGVPVQEIARTVGVSRPTIYAYLKEQT